MRNFLQSLFRRKTDAPDTAAATILAGLPFEMIAVPGHEAIKTRESLLPKSGITPVILGSEEDIQLLVDGVENNGPPARRIIEAAAKVDLAAWMRERRESNPDVYIAAPGEWPSGPQAQRELSVPFDVVTRQPKKNVLVALFPTSRSWEVPAHVRYGSRNTCPPATVHIALHQLWNERWGAEIACMSSDVIECTVAKPPQTRVAALELAQEHMVYCPDIVHQGTQSVEALAAALLGARTWYFWWD
jgi:hypothetical protein